MDQNLLSRAMARNQDVFCCFSSPEPSDGGGFPFLRQAVPQKRFMAQGHEDLKMLQAPPVGCVCPSPSGGESNQESGVWGGYAIIVRRQFVFCSSVF